MMLKERFPNLSEFLKEVTESFKGGFVLDSEDKLSYKMPVITFNQHVGDNWLILKKENEGYRLSIESKVGSRIKVKTDSTRVYKYDLTLTEWDEELNNLLPLHSAKPEYINFGTEQMEKRLKREISGRNSGCLIFMVIGTIISLFAYIIL